MGFISELGKEKYWLRTYERMKSKRLTEEEVIELDDVYGDKKEIIVKIKNKEYEWGKCNKVEIDKSETTRKRKVYIYSIRDRYLMGVMYRVMTELHKESISENCFSYKRGIHTASAIDYLMSDKDIHSKYGVKLDISSYFNSVSKEYITEMIEEVTEGEEELAKLLGEIYYNDEIYFRGELIQEYKGMAPGTPISSFFANYCLKDLDKYMTDELKVTYARYSDDIIMFTHTEKELHEMIEVFKKEIAKAGLKINEDKYERYKPGDTITYLGLKFNNDVINVSDYAFKKSKRKIKRSCKYHRKQIEIYNQDPYKEASKFLKRYNSRIYKSYLQDKTKFGWAFYAFRYINTLDTLREIDFYLKDRVRQMITGKNNQANIKKVPDEKLKELGYVSMCDMYLRFKDDYDMYCDTVDII